MVTDRHRPPAINAARPSARHRQDRLQYTAPLRLVCSVITIICTEMHTGAGACIFKHKSARKG